jgi:arylsulfatase A-like enzyme
MNKNPNYGKNPPQGEVIRRRPMDKDSGEQTVDAIIHAGAISLTLIFLEIVFKLAVGGSIESSFFVYITLFSLSAGIVMSLISSFFSEKVNHIICSSMLVFVTVYFCVQLVYDDFFPENFAWQQMFAAGTDVASFWREALVGIRSLILWILLMFLPTILYIVFGKKFLPAVKTMHIFKGAIGALAVVLFFAGVGFVNVHTDDFGDAYYYNEEFSTTDAVSRFGVLTTLRLDTLYTIFGRPEGEMTSEDPPVTVPDSGWDNAIIIEGETTTAPPTITVTDAEGNVSVIEPPPIDDSPNVMSIDFNKLIANSSGNLKTAHEWFSKREPTNKNAYTGIFEGKNLVCITVEGWAPAAINEKLTPTLYKMKNEGFVFENYYCSNWGGSTATGEYAVMTGNFYSSSACLKKSASNYMPFVLGNMMKNVGYKTDAFHNHTYTYYGRDKSHPNFGYGWHGVGNWPEATFKSAWPKSDRELAVNSLSYITADKPFHMYYMTVSGHAYHTGNAQASKHKSYVKSLNLGYTTNGAICYLAAQYEVELMVQELCAELERKGELENTVFVMAPDHYPYSIVGKTDSSNQAVDDAEGTIQALSELYGLPAEDIFLNFDLYRAPLIIWSASMEKPVKVDKVCSAIDVLPTVLNLFGANYDSRLIMGRDILSTSDGFVLLNCSNSSGISSSNNWVTKYGSYNSRTKTFVRNPKYTQDQINGLLSEGYIEYHNDLLKKMRTYSNYILENDYYRKVFGK